MSEIIIQAKSIAKVIDKKTIFKNVDIEINKGESISIVGRSGSGKSTLLNIFGLIDSYSEGTLNIFGKEAKEMSSREKRNIYRQDIGFIFQDYGLIYEQTVEQNLLNSLYFKKMTGESKKKSIIEILNYFSFEDKISQKIEKLSGGEQQRVALMKLLLKKPRLILADEPTGSLDEDNKNVVIQELLRLCENGSSLVLVTHDLELAMRTNKKFLLGREFQ